jgi:hypothetical protein
MCAKRERKPCVVIWVQDCRNPEHADTKRGTHAGEGSLATLFKHLG